MRSSKVLATLLSMVMLFCMLPGPVARADSPTVDIHFDTEIVRSFFSGTTWLYANAGGTISGPVSTSDIDGYIHSTADGAVLSSSMFTYTGVNDGNPEHRLMQVDYSCDDQSIFDAGASANVVVNGVPFSYYGFHDDCYAFTSSKVAGISVLIGQGLVILNFNTDFLGTVEMYRLYNPNSGEHFYTSNEAERNTLIGLGWNYEGIGWIAPNMSNVPVYRLYNQYGGEHHYTTSSSERNALIAAGWNDEGIGWYSSEGIGWYTDEGLPLVTHAGDDYTAAVLTMAGWVDTGDGWFSGDVPKTPLYRQYNPNAFANNHNYTTSLRENDDLVALGWRAEAIGWYGIG